MRPFLPSSKLEFRRVVSNTVLKGVCTVDAPGAGNAMTRRVPFARICTVSCLYSAVFGGHTTITRLVCTAPSYPVLLLPGTVGNLQWRRRGFYGARANKLPPRWEVAPTITRLQGGVGEWHFLPMTFPSLRCGRRLLSWERSRWWKTVAGIQIEVGGGCRGMHWKAALHHTSFFAWTSGGLADCPTAWAQLRAGGGGSALSEAGTRLTASGKKCLCGGRGAWTRNLRDTCGRCSGCG
ncbi:hypothetical protein TCDM_11063 [Trypanosoma cruzi Dm28c]|uniref:Uncharacterized protein n=1 Tax=Trypanosoma cruzi Dm28c TaxID=1416333 RepID=V5BAD9_TRYCR|nr:hypothetical protein TCDM_11063 [Trypanosoma cruzi Dm28c]PBJ70650.1 hypothetical protein BCY84_18262 [Trypanosoma cruzi cruzi]PBJ70692.1 hypothetical protein BCY84_18258 [Trypanosoma cruzi cruzi]PBJ75299.1 hypothetical protein BCY84_11330 [Trypanosoma cruzi cruzi]PBJ75300.1 hypothetical protein BCY84_11332 [Trypanosoma cruzi cruzi]